MKLHFLQEMLINIKTSHFHNSINHQEQFFHRALMTGYLRPVNIVKFLRTGFFIEHLQKQYFADIPQNRYSLKFCQLHRKALVLESRLKNLQPEGLQLHERLQHMCFPVKFSKFLRTPFLTEHLR